MGSTNTYHLPWPELGDMADGPDGFQDLAAATETALKTFTPLLVNQRFTVQTISANTTKTLTMSGIPLNKTFQGSVFLTAVRITGSQYLVIQVFDGSTQVGSDSAVLSSIGTGMVFPVTVPLARKFTVSPKLVLFAAGGPTVTVDSVLVVGGAI